MACEAMVAVLNDDIICLPRSQMKGAPPSKEDEEVTAGSVNNQAAEVEVTDPFPQCELDGAALLSEEERFRHSGDQHSDDTSPPHAEAKPESECQLTLTEDRGSSTAAVASGAEPLSAEQDCCRGDVEAGARLVQADVHASLENGEKEPPALEVTEADSETRGDEDDDDEDGSRKEDYSEGDLVDVSAYSGLGEDDSGGSQLDDDDDEEEEEEEAYHPESSCTEIEGLPEEEEPIGDNRKIRFSTEPIKVSSHLQSPSTLRVSVTSIQSDAKKQTKICCCCCSFHY